VVSFGVGVKKRVSLNTLAMQQRTQAARIIFELSTSQGTLLGNYLLPFLEVLHTMVVDRHSNDLRATAATALHSVFSVIVLARQDGVNLQTMATTILDKLVSALKVEPDPGARSAQAESLRDILCTIYSSGTQLEGGIRVSPFVADLSDEMAFNITTGCLLQCAECVIRRNDKESRMNKNEGLDEEDREAQRDEIEEDDDQLIVLIDIFGHLLKLLRERYVPVFDRMLAPSFSSYLEPHQPQVLQILATSLIDDAIEFGGVETVKYVMGVANALFANTQCEDNDTLRQCSLYGLAVATAAAPTELQSFVAPLLGCFVSTMLRPDAMEDDNIGITENAVFGVGNMLVQPLYRDAILEQSDTFPMLDLVKLWLKKLPLTMDEMEAKSSLKNVLDLFERKDAVFFPVADEESPFLAEIVRIFAEGAKSYLLGCEEAKKIKFIVDEDVELVTAHKISVERIRLLFQSQMGASLSKAAGKLSVSLQQALRDIMA
jgi:hypothetical protein